MQPAGPRPALVTCALGLLFLVAAAAFDAEPLYVPGIAFLALAAGTLAWVHLSARGIAVEREVGARSVLEEQPVPIEIHVTAGALPLPAGAVIDPLLPETAALAAGRRTTTLRINARFARRGRRVLAPSRVLVADPFGLAAREISAGGPDELLVLPRLPDVVGVREHGGGDALGLSRGRPVVAAEVDLDGVRPYRLGAPASRIVWPALARSGELLERRLRADSDTRPLVVLDPRGAATPEDLDDAVRAAAALTKHLARAGGCAVLLPGDRRPTGLDPTMSGWARMHVRFALAGDNAGPALGALGNRRGPVLYVAARRLTRPPRALALAPASGRLLVIPGTISGRRPSFTVGECTGYEMTGSRQAAEVA